MKLKVCFVIVILFLAMTAGIAAADIPPLKYKDPDYQGHPSIYENRVVWQDYRNGSMDIYMYDLATGIEKPVCTAAGYQGNPTIYRNYIVWEDHRNGYREIYMYDISTGAEKQLTNMTHSRDPAIHGNYVVWQTFSHENVKWNVYIYDISTGKEEKVSTGISSQLNPAIYGNYVVWEGVNNSDTAIFVYDLVTGIAIPISDVSGSHGYPAIHGNKITWKNDHNDVYMYDISTDTKITISKKPRTSTFLTISTFVIFCIAAVLYLRKRSQE